MSIPLPTSPPQVRSNLSLVSLDQNSAVDTEDERERMERRERRPSLSLNTEITSDDEEDLDAEFEGFGGLGTSFDDAYTDLSGSYKFLDTAGAGSALAPGLKNRDKLRERTEWQSMLTSVLTGEVFTSEKTRIRGTRSSPYQVEDTEERWLELRAKVCGRSLGEQRRYLTISRSTTPEVLNRITNFRLESQYESVREPFFEVKELLDSLSKCEALWPDCKALANSYPKYASQEFKTRVNALTAWFTVTQSILLELKLLTVWTGNDAADPTERPQNGGDSLVEHMSKQKSALRYLFKNRVQACIFPLIERARQCTIDYAQDFLAVGLPLFHVSLEPVMAFPFKIIREVIRLRLAYVRHEPAHLRRENNDETILRLQEYMTLGLFLTEEYQHMTKPLFDKGWFFQRKEVDILNTAMLECISLYLELLSNKFLGGNTRDQQAEPFHRSFQNIEQLEQHYLFLQETCRLIEGGDISVAERFTTLLARCLDRLQDYWNRRTAGPPNWTPSEIERWFRPSIENIRSSQRKLLRYYRLMCNRYDNASEYTLSNLKMKDFISEIRKNGFFLVFVGSMERMGIYTFASPGLRDQPQTIRNLLHGHCRTRPSDQPPRASVSTDTVVLTGDTKSVASETPGTEVEAILMFSIKEPLVWDGDIFHMETLSEHVKPVSAGRVRLVVQGGHAELSAFRSVHKWLDSLNIIVFRRSNLAKVDLELTKSRALFYKLSYSVITSAMSFRHRMRPYNSPETVQLLFAFAREFGQRGLSIMSPSKRGSMALRLIDLAIEWVSFVSDDCPPSDPKTFKATVMALEFAMVMTRGVNIVAISDSQFLKLRRKVADCVTLLISHFDIMGARSKAAFARDARDNSRLLGHYSRVALKDDDELIALQHESILEKLAALEDRRSKRFSAGKVLDTSNTEVEFLSFASSSLSNTSIRWQQGQYIGSGAFGSVYQAHDLDSGQVIAVKEVRITSPQSMGHVLRSIKDEMTVLEMLSHPNVVQYFGVEVHRERVFIFMEYCESSLARMLEYGRFEDEFVTQTYSLQILEGLAYLHQSGILHRDIKPENILLDYKGEVKIVDFGAAKVIAKNRQTIGGNSSSRTRLGSLTGTPMYMSPEVILGKPGGRFGAIDVWSVGCCVLEMVTGRRPWAHLDNDFSIMYHIAGSKLPQMPTDEQASKECQRFLLRALDRDPAHRPTALELQTDPWLAWIRAQATTNNDDHPVISEPPKEPDPLPETVPVLAQELEEQEHYLEQQDHDHEEHYEDAN